MNQPARRPSSHPRAPNPIGGPNCLPLHPAPVPPSRMPNYRRNLAPGATYFFTVNLADRRSP